MDVYQRIQAVFLDICARTVILIAHVDDMQQHRVQTVATHLDDFIRELRKVFLVYCTWIHGSIFVFYARPTVFEEVDARHALSIIVSARLPVKCDICLNLAAACRDRWTGGECGNAQ